MKYLLDTHVVLWFLSDADRLSKKVQNIILEPASYKFVSVVSAWEMAIKISLGKLEFEGGIVNFFQMLDENDFSLLPVRKKHVSALETLQFHHRDPFDRMLIAASVCENMSLITSDANIRLYENVACVW